MSQHQETLRVFIALVIPPAAKEALAQTIGQLRESLPTGVRWVDPNDIHLTLKFLGNISPALVAPVLEGMTRSSQDFPTIGLGLEGLGAFPNSRQPRVLWAGADGDMNSLSQLQERVEREISPLGFPSERRGFNPHLTLGRVRDNATPTQRGQIGDLFLRQSLVPTDSWLAQELHLIQSVIRPGQANLYPSIGSVALTGSR